MSTQTIEVSGVRVAVEGCGHGTLDAIYASVAESCAQRGWDGVDVLIIGGDFQAVRNAADLTIMSCPVKYRHLGDFPFYYSGARTAPYLTLFIAGNHEASSHLWELYYGGWVAPNIYYFGAANVLRLGPLRIAGLGGIWKGGDYNKNHHERLPFSQDDVRSFYHVRELDVRKLLLLRTQVDIGMSHDWPRAVERHGDERELFRKKPFFEQESRDGTLGNPAAGWVMDRLRPRYWFSAHMHCRFSALKKYDSPEAAPSSSSIKEEEPKDVKVSQLSKQSNPDEIDLDSDGDDEAGGASTGKAPREEARGEEAEDLVAKQVETLRAQLPASFQRTEKGKPQPGQPVPPTITNTETRFLALDKCLPGRHFLQLCEIHALDLDDAAKFPPGRDQPRYRLQYDPEWLAINRVFSKYLTIGDGDKAARPPKDLGEKKYAAMIDEELVWVAENVTQKMLDVPENFVHTAPSYVEGTPEIVSEQPKEYTNPQTVAYCTLIGVPNLWDASEEDRTQRYVQGPRDAEKWNRRGGGFGGGQGGGRGGGNWNRGGGRGFGRGGGRGRGRGRGGRW